MAVKVEIGANLYHQGELYAKDIVILTYDDNHDKETQIYILYDVEDGKYQISCFTQTEDDHTLFDYTPLAE